MNPWDPANQAEHKLSKEQKRQEKLKRRQREADIRAVMTSPAGRRVMWWIIEDLADTLSSSAMPSGSETYWREGQRAVGLDIWNELQRVTPENYVLMFRESSDARRAESAQQQAAEVQSADRENE